MILKPVHVEFYRLKKTSPSWASLCYSKGNKPRQPRDLIDSCIHAHAGEKNPTSADCDLHNFLVLCRLWRKTGKLYSELLGVSGGCPGHKKREALAKKWLSKMPPQNSQELTS